MGARGERGVEPAMTQEGNDMQRGYERGWVELAHAPELPWEPAHGENWPFGAEVKVLSRDESSGALTGIVRLPEGYRRGAGHHEGATEYLVLSGGLRVGGGAAWEGLLRVLTIRHQPGAVGQRRGRRALVYGS